MRVQVLVRLKNGVLDVQGKAVESGLLHLGHKGVRNVRVGKLIELEVDAKSSDEARKAVEKMCAELLVNEIIEQYEIKS